MANSENLGANFVLTGAIDCTGTPTWNSNTGFAPIGDSGHPFTGTFDGRNYAIDGLTMNRSSTDGIGLFGSIRGTVKNLKLTSVNITNAQYGTGGLAGYANGATISHVSVGGVINSASGAGGLIGRTDAGVTITKASFTGTVTSGDLSAGLVGISVEVSISDSYANATIHGGNESGGFIGHSQSSNDYPVSITNSYFAGDIYTP